MKKRRRPARSCEQCRQRKVKCNLEEPCGPCIRARASLACSYRLDTVRKDSSTTTAQPEEQLRSGVGSLPGSEPQRRLSTVGHHEQTTRQSSMVDHAVDAQNVQHADGAASTSEAHGMALEQGVTESVRLERSVPRRTSSNSTARPRKRRKTGTSDLFVTPLSPRLRVALDKSRLVGPMHWSRTADEVSRCESSIYERLTYLSVSCIWAT